MSFKSELYKVDPETGDILPTAKRTLGDYLSRRTSKATDSAKSPTGGPDDYTYNPPRPNAFPVGAEPADGDTLRTDPSRNLQPTFTTSQDELERWGESGRFDTEKFILNDLDQQDRHRLLKQVSTTGESSNRLTTEVQRQIGVSLSRNRFASNKAFNSGENPNPTVEKLDTNGRRLSPVGREESLYSEMANQAIAALIAATGETPKSDARKTTGGDVLSPSPVQGNFGTLDGDGLKKLDTQSLHPEDIANYSRLSFDPSTAELLDGVSTETADSGGDVGKYTRFSSGNLNSYLEPFGTSLPSSMITAAGILLVCAIVITLVTANILTLIARAIPRETGTLPVGSDRGDPFGKGLDFTNIDSYTDFFSKTLGLIHPYTAGNPLSKTPYVGAALSGVAAFVGVDVEKIDSGRARAGSTSGVLDVNTLITNALGGPGYYVVMTRNIMRSLTLLGETLPSPSVSVGAIESLIGFITKVKESKIVRFTDTMARLGVVKQMTFLREQKSSMTRPVDEENPTMRIAQSRALRGQRVLSYSHTFASNRGAHLLPKSFRYASIAYNNGEKNVAGLLGKTGSSTRDIYLAPEEVSEIENELEAEYVPFYLHDLRTNEILNFHAFLETLEDSYTPTWTSVDGYGRMDPVQIYKGTTRSISLSFMVVATNEEDFDRVWYTINKLVMMVYPQWTGGNEIEGQGEDGKSYSFVQPFSQVIGSAPLIRMRVGELIHSNYSRFGLARIFGLGGVSSDKGGKRHFTKEDEKPVSDQIEYLSQPRDLLSEFTVIGKIDEVGKTVVELWTRYVGTRVKVMPGSYSASMFENELRSTSGTPYIANLNGIQNAFAIIEDFVELPSPTGGRAMYSIVRLENSIPADVVGIIGLESIFSIEYLLVPVDKISPDEAYYAKLYSFTPPNDGAIPKQSPTSPTNSTLSSLSENFGNSKTLISSNTKNSIVRSFESAGGRGLAGAITSLNFTWYDDNTTWEIKQGSRAPMACKVSINFAPIHDIPMGLDSEGMPRAVPYPVGGIVRSTFFPELHNNDTEKVSGIINRYENKAKKK